MVYAYIMYICIYIYMYVCVYINKYIYIYICLCICMHITHTRICIYLYISILTHISIYVYLSARCHFDRMVCVEVRSVFKISCLFLGPRPWQFEIRDSTDKEASYLLLGFDTLNLKFCDLKL